MKNVNYRHILPAITLVFLAGVFISASSKTTEGLSFGGGACNDSDGGENFYIQGTTTGPIMDGTLLTLTDWCGPAYAGGPNNVIHENGCNPAPPYNIYETTAICPLGCSNGACLGVPPDTTAPVLSNPQPSGIITATDTNLSAATDEPATCRYSIIANAPYDAMTSTTTAQGLLHEWSLSGFANGDYVYYIRCADLAGNQNIADYPVAFAVNVTPPTDALNFSLSMDLSGDVDAGKNKTTYLKIKPLSESSGIVNLSCRNLPSGVSCIFRKPAINITDGDSEEIKLTFATSKETITGRYNISVRGTSGGITKSANYLLKIKSDEETATSYSHD